MRGQECLRIFRLGLWFTAWTAYLHSFAEPRSFSSVYPVVALQVDWLIVLFSRTRIPPLLRVLVRSIPFCDLIDSARTQRYNRYAREKKKDNVSIPNHDCKSLIVTLSLFLTPATTLSLLWFELRLVLRSGVVVSIWRLKFIKSGLIDCSYPR